MERFLTWSGLVVLAAMGGYIAGRAVSLDIHRDPPFTLRPDTRPRIAVVEFLGVREGEIVGKMQGELRLFVGEDMVIPDGSGAFRIASDFFVTEDVELPIPPGARFVASRRGWRYYPIHTPQAQELKPENRVYFSTAEEAEEAGYTR